MNLARGPDSGGPFSGRAFFHVSFRAYIRHSLRSSSAASSATKAFAKSKAAQAQLAHVEKEAYMMKLSAVLNAM